MRILGIDPGTATVGFGVIEIFNGKTEVLDYGCIKTEKTLNAATRLSQIKRDLSELIEQWNPDRAVVEKLFFSKNVKTAMAVSQSRGVILQTLEEKNIDVAEYTPHEMKMNICGDGKATKQGIQKMVKLILKLAQIPKPDDAADALGLALCRAEHEKLASMQEQRQSRL